MKWSVTYTDNSGIGPEDFTEIVDADSYEEACDQVLSSHGWESYENFEEEADDYDYEIHARPIKNIGYVAVLTDRNLVPEVTYVRAESKDLALELAYEFFNSGKYEKKDTEGRTITVQCLPNQFQSEEWS